MDKNKMKRWPLLLALPYVVMQTEFNGTTSYFVVNSSGVVVGTCSEETFCNDLADALNQSHLGLEEDQKRANQPPEPEIPNTLEGSTPTEPIQ